MENDRINTERMDERIKYMRSLYINRYDYLRSSMIVQTSGVNNVLRVS